MPFSNQIIALAQNPSPLKPEDDSMYLLLKNLPGSRRKCTFDIRKSHVLLFEMISEDMFLAKLKSEESDSKKRHYWTLMDVDGKIHKINPIL